ncbi:putative isomerase YddE [BD1-7 clade bacterium]|uniref:Putative isomerase YddE n=1 Tax=BD1-7 clade bacterium TaxID=2029982 RepID=A0A5S9R031_9GAMM|nr:putative isomerase YddE [BD1-7 clade bacterium]
MNVKMYQVDAFAGRAFEGNPAAVCLLDSWLDDAVMQLIAAENNLSETAFVVQQLTHFEIRWFTPLHEVDLCGHATLASAHALFMHAGVKDDVITFRSRSGELEVARRGHTLEMDLPALMPEPCEIPVDIVKAFGAAPLQCLKATDYIVVFDEESDVSLLTPDMSRLRNLDARGVIVTAASDTYDFVTRMFAPKLGIDEDPVTGSAFCQLIPYWADITRKTQFTAKQVSPRGGYVEGQLNVDRVLLRGTCVTYLVGEIYLPL